MLSTLIFRVLLLPGLLVNGNRFCPGDKSLAEVHHTFEKYNVGLISFAASLSTLTGDADFLHFPSAI
jgi:hypothetical protein